MTRNHVIISGTGRAGTTFLVQLLTDLGLDTGFADSLEGVYANCNAGMELDLRQSNSPYIVKSPWLCDYLEEILESGEVDIDHAIVPMRDLYSAAESRRFVSSQSEEGVLSNVVPGGLWDSQQPNEQEKVLSEKFYHLIYVLVQYNVPIAFLLFPRFILDPIYLYSRLWFLLNNIPYEEFITSFHKISKPGLVHDFPKSVKENDR